MPIITFAAGTTQTINNFSAIGTLANPITITSDSDYLRATLSKSLPNTTLDYCYVKNMIFTGTANFKAIHSFDLGGNLGLRFVDVTLTDILNDIDTKLPNKFSSATKLAWLNDAQRKLWKYFNEQITLDFDTIENQQSYPVPNNLRFENIDQVLISNSTTVLGSTTAWQEYNYSGYGDFNSRSYNYFVDDNKLGLYPIPDNTGYHVRVKYEPRAINLASTDVEVLYFNEDYLDALKYTTMATIARSGNYPDIELSNNYIEEMNELVKNARFTKAKRKSKLNKNVISYSEGWDN